MSEFWRWRDGRYCPTDMPTAMEEWEATHGYDGRPRKFRQTPYYAELARYLERLAAGHKLLPP